MSWYDQIEIEDMTYDATLEIFHYPCPCGDRFEVSIEDLLDGSTTTATCPSCSLTIEIVFQPKDLKPYADKLQSQAISV